MMGTFTTKIKLGDTGYVIRGHLDYYVKEMRVGQVEIKQKHPEARSMYSNEKLYEERYMCFETGVGCGTVYTYGEHIFSTKKDAENIGLVKYKQKAYKQIAERDAREAEQQEYQRRKELAELERLKSKYEAVGEGDGQS